VNQLWVDAALEEDIGRAGGQLDSILLLLIITVVIRNTYDRTLKP
jgi:hypothetical protein